MISGVMPGRFLRERLRDVELKEPVDAFFWVTFYLDPRYSLKADSLKRPVEVQCKEDRRI